MLSGVRPERWPINGSFSTMDKASSQQTNNGRKTVFKEQSGFVFGITGCWTKGLTVQWDFFLDC